MQGCRVQSPLGKRDKYWTCTSGTATSPDEVVRSTSSIKVSCVDGRYPHWYQGLKNGYYLVSLPRVCAADWYGKRRNGWGWTMKSWYGLDHNTCLDGAIYLVDIKKHRYDYNTPANWGPKCGSIGDPSGAGDEQDRYYGKPTLVYETQGSNKWLPRWSNPHFGNNPAWPGSGGFDPPNSAFRCNYGKDGKGCPAEDMWIYNGQANWINLGCLGAKGTGCCGKGGSEGSLAHDLCIAHYASQLNEKKPGHKGIRKFQDDFLCGYQAWVATIS